MIIKIEVIQYVIGEGGKKVLQYGLKLGIEKVIDSRCRVTIVNLL